MPDHFKALNLGPDASEPAALATYAVTLVLFSVFFLGLSVFGLIA